MTVDLPRLGLGTYSEENKEAWTDRVRTALDMGYRHVDTAEVYGNEEYVGEGIAASSVDRDEVFLATKTVHIDVPPSADRVDEAIDGCLDRLGVDYVDLMYVHWPAGIYDPESVLPAFDRAYAEGKIRNVGLSNFTPELLDEARERLDAPLAAHQVEMHPFLQQEELAEYAREHDHWLVAYAPLAQGAVFDVPEVREVADRHGVSPAQVSLAWLLSKENVAAIPKASGEEHMRDNLEAAEMELDAADVERIDSVAEERRLIDREYAPWNE